MSNVKLTPPEAYKHAVGAFQAGKLREAEQICQLIITAKNDFFDAIHLLAIVQSRLGRKSDALATFDRAIAVQPQNPEVYNNRGITLREMQRFEEALTNYGLALAIRPDYAEALNNRGNALKELKRFEEALASYERAIEIRPDYIEAQNNHGNTLQELKRFKEALAAFDRLLGLKPDHAGALNNRGVALRAMQRHDEALASYDRALAAAPNYAEAHYNRGNTLHEMKRFDEALASYERAIALQPNHAEAFNNRGNAQRELDRYQEALESYAHALTIRSDYAEAFSNRGKVLMDLSQPQEALATFDQALALWPSIDAIHYNRGLAFHELRRFGEAVESYDRAISLRPDYANAHFARGVCLLLQGDFDRGWQEFEWRWLVDKKGPADLKRVFAQPLWLGKANIDGRTVLLHGEQGFGDIIQFCRFARLVAERGAKVVLEVQPELASLMQSLDGCAQVIAQGDELPSFDYHAPLMSLPLAFMITPDDIPNQIPYLTAPKERTKLWSDRLGPLERPRVGLVWAGNPRMGMANANRIDRQRSMHFDQIASLFESTDCQFISLQKGGEAVEQLRRSPFHDHVIDVTDELHDFAETAAVIENLDLVIAVDTSVPHLVGALGKPVWLMNRYNTCWRWLLDRDDSPWYPTARLFRQDETRSWDGVIQRVHAALRDFVKNAKG